MPAVIQSTFDRFRWSQPVVCRIQGSRLTSTVRAWKERVTAETHNGAAPPKHKPEETAAWERFCIDRTRAGDPDAFGNLVEQYSQRVYTHLFRLVRHREEAEDLTQETFLRAYRSLSRFDASRPFRNWLLTIATNVGLNALRAKRRKGFLVSLDKVHDGAVPVEAADTQEDGRRRAVRRDLAERVAAAVKRLSPRSALLVNLHCQEGMSIREAAEVAGLSEGAAKVALCRARRSLREWLIEDER